MSKVFPSLLADECLDKIIVESLKESGFNVVTAKEAGLLGAVNGTLIKASLERRTVFITQDKDFADIPTYPPQNHLGIIVIKSHPMDLPQTIEVLKAMLKKTPSEEFIKTLFVVDKNKFRVRR